MVVFIEFPSLVCFPSSPFSLFPLSYDEDEALARAIAESLQDSEQSSPTGSRSGQRVSSGGKGESDFINENLLDFFLLQQTQATSTTRKTNSTFSDSCVLC